MMRTMFVMAAIAAATILATPEEGQARHRYRGGYYGYSQPYYGGGYYGGYYRQPYYGYYYQQPYYGRGYYQPYYNNNYYGNGGAVYYGGRRGGFSFRF